MGSQGWAILYFFIRFSMKFLVWLSWAAPGKMKSLVVKGEFPSGS